MNERDVRNKLLQEKALRGDKWALEELVQSVDSLLYQWVNKVLHHNTVHPLYEEYVSNAKIALVLAAPKWNPERSSWGTYAWSVLRTSMHHTSRHVLSQRETTIDTISINSVNEMFLDVDRTDYQEEVDARLLLEDFKKILGPLELKVLEGMLAETLKGELGETLGMKKDTLLQLTRRIKQKYLEYLEASKRIYHEDFTLQ